MVVQTQKTDTRISIFVDLQNIFYTTRDVFGQHFNYRIFWETIERQARIIKAFAYAIDRGDEGQRKFQSALSHIGFTVKLKPYIHRSDGTSKGDWDVGIAIDVLDSLSDTDSGVLLSGDGDFSVLLDRVASAGLRTEVYSVEELTANALIRSATMYHPIDSTMLL